MGLFVVLSLHSRGRSGLSGAALLLLAAATLAGLAGPAEATRGVANYPRIAQYVCSVGSMTPAQLDTLAWYDLVLLRDSPQTVAKIRQRNPEIELFYNWMPQNIVKWNENSTWWYPDTTWSLGRLCLFYAKQNDWYLRDTNGNRIPEADGYAANWTRYCPKGTYGSSKGLNYVEWLVQVVMPRIITSGTVWPKWGPGSSSYDGLDLEILVDCVGSFGWQTYAQADPDRDGIAEGVYHSCEMGGDADSLSILYREMNDLFHTEVARLQDEGVLILLNTATKRMMPAWRTEVTGIKIERWCSYLWNPWVDWWEGFYGVLDYNNEEMLGPGYRWAEDMVGYHGDDAIEGWDHTLLQVIPAPAATPAEKARVKRWGLGTALLGDGFFNYTPDECGLWWQPEFEWDFGAPLGPYQRDTYSGNPPDTLYTRTFALGFVEVNPYTRPVGGVAARDSRFGFWQTVSDLSGTAEGTDAIRVSWTAPPQQLSPVDGAELRYATFPVTPDTWNAATPFAGNPITGSPGEAISRVVSGLAPHTTYHFAVRHRVHGRLEPGTSNPAEVQTLLSLQDVSPPGAITDLRSSGVGQNWIDLAWTAPSEESEPGRASAYRVRYRLGGPITSEGAWNAATPAAGPVPTPGVPGTPEQFRLAGLQAGMTYGIAVRAEDAAGNLGMLSNSFAATTASAPPPPPPPSDTTPPATVADLRVQDAGETWVELAWTAPGDDGALGTPQALFVRALAGRAILNEADWAAAFAPSTTPPAPVTGGQTQIYRFEGLPPDSLHGFSVRARDDAGLMGGISNPVTGRTEPLYVPPPPPVQRPPGPVTDLVVTELDTTWARLQWTAPDNGEGGICAQYRIAVLEGDSLRGIADLSRASIRILPSAPAAPGTIERWTLQSLSPGTLHGVAVFAFDAAMVAGEMGPAVHFRTLEPAAPPPPPPPPALPDTLAPETVTDLRIVAAGTDWVTLAWTAPADRGEEVATRADVDRRVSGYRVRRLAGGPIEDEAGWAAAEPLDTAGLIPAEPGKTDTLRVPALSPGMHGFCVRAVDAHDHEAARSNPVVAEIAPPPPPPDLTPPPGAGPVHVTAAGPRWAEISWTLAGEADPSDIALWRIAIRAGAEIGDEAGWAAADTSREVEVTPGQNSATWGLHLDGLDPQTGYGVTVRSIDVAGNRSALATAPLWLLTPPLPDTIPPCRIVDLAAIGAGTDWIDLEWTAPADSVTGAEVSGYEIARLAGEAIDSDADWARATIETGLVPHPAIPGEMEAVRVGGLAPGTQYGFALRARDQGGLAGAVSNPILVATALAPPPPDVPPDTLEVPPDRPPAAPGNLTVLSRDADGATLQWIAAGEDSLEGTATTYFVRVSIEGAILTEADWSGAGTLPLTAPPRPAGEMMPARVEPLDAAEEGWIAVRAADAAGQWSPLSASVYLERFRPPPFEPVPPPMVDSVEVVSTGTYTARLRLVHPEATGDTPPPVAYETRASLASLDASTWAEAALVESPAAGPAGETAEWVITGLSPATTYFVAVRARSEDGLESPLSRVLRLQTSSEDLAPPDAPAEFTATWQAGGTRLALAWDGATDPRISGYRLYGQGPASGWYRILETAGGETSCEIDRPDPAILRRLAVRSVTRGGTESPLSSPVELFASSWDLLGPYPHPVRESCRLRLTVPVDVSPGAVVRLEIVALDGRPVAELLERAVLPGDRLEVEWDRRTHSGELAAPGLHYLVCTGAGRRLVRPVYLAP